LFAQDYVPLDDGRQGDERTREQEVSDFITSLVSSWDIDKELEKIFWGFASKDLVLANLTQEEVEQILADFDETIMQYMMSRTEWEFSWEEDMAITQFRAWLRARLSRGRRGFERKMQTTQTLVRHQVVEGSGAVEEGRGRILSKLGRIFGRKEEERPQVVEVVE